jgi:hypothetical protein
MSEPSPYKNFGEWYDWTLDNWEKLTTEEWLHAAYDEGAKAERDRLQTKLEAGRLAFETLAEERDHLKAELAQAQARCAEANLLLQATKDLLGHTHDCPMSLARNSVAAGFVTNLTLPCSEHCKAVSTFLSNNRAQPLLNRLEKLEQVYETGAAYMEPATLTPENRGKREIAFVEALAACKEKK